MLCSYAIFTLSFYIFSYYGIRSDMLQINEYDDDDDDDDINVTELRTFNRFDFDVHHFIRLCHSVNAKFHGSSFLTTSS